MVVRPAEEEGDDGGWRRSGASGRRRLTKKKCFWDAAAGGVGGFLTITLFENMVMRGFVRVRVFKSKRIEGNTKILKG
ncbi:hypothetical protein E3N88_24901 [Mikania micrantha]|uniref:Uncharacterized protein n=1 Tax=Mikania micrantha TaxID=192012 RepID=A0A5N6N4H8_9ASTR|nr:hypothetical protein E3N88_24901 [Mikania micrantha]